MSDSKYSKRVRNTNRLELDMKKTFVQEVGFKPHGLWYGFGSDWKNFLLGNELDLFDTDVELTVDEKSLFIIDSKESLRRFLDPYKQDTKPYSTINWQHLALEYKGVEVRNYWSIIMDFRTSNDYTWLITWDISSGCIWDLTAITSYKKI